MSHEALVFHITHGSLVDSYGIRGTVLLKGRPLECIRRYNPERQSFQLELKVDRSQCNGCGNCLNICSRNVLPLVGDLVQTNRDICDRYMECAEHCYISTLEPFGVRYTAHEIFEIVRSDEIFYKSIGGGAIIGDGEYTCHSDFMLELTQLCHNSGIHVAVDTCGYTTSSKALGVLKVADLFLFDTKGTDPMRHKRNTGKSNEVILQNLRLLSEVCKPMIIRVPVIPGYNDSDEELNGIADLLPILKLVERVDILPEHEFGRIRYEQLDLEYRLKPCPVSAERQDAIRVMLKAKGFHIQIGGQQSPYR